MGNFFTDVIQKSPLYRANSPVNDPTLLEPSFRAKVQATIDDAMRSLGVELVSTETYRSSERQQLLFSQGKTQLRLVGVHHYGLAIDFARRVNGKLTWDGDWAFMGPLAKKHGIISGADWGEPNVAHSFRDWDHLQGVTLAEQRGLLAGTWYPNATSVGGTAPLPASAPDIVAKKLLPPAKQLLPAQQEALDEFDDLNRTYFSNWFNRSSFMAFAEVESSFNTHAFRQEPTDASYGLMQVLYGTAQWLGCDVDAEMLYDPTYGIFYGLKYAAWGWNYLMGKFGRPPTLDEWCAGYNEGYGAVVNGRPDEEYVEKWTAARAKWANIFGEK